MASGDPIDRAYLEISGTRLPFDSIDNNPEDGSKFVEAMTPDREPLGVVSGTVKYTLKGTLTMRVSEEIDLHSIWRNKTLFQAAIEYEGGKTWSWGRAKLSKCDLSSKNGEETKWTVEVLAWMLVIS